MSVDNPSLRAPTRNLTSEVSAVRKQQHNTRKRICLLGSTGSIGRQALEVIAAHSDRLEAVALAAHSSGELLAVQAQQFGVDSTRTCLTARDGMDALTRLITDSEPDIVLNALVGAAGLRATIATLEAGLTLALANKESLVVGGELVTALAASDQMLPVDSEHSAIFQCLVGESVQALKHIWLTASGGPFRGMSREELACVKAADALAHPTWQMGPKITIDCATLMNKGLEAIEAHHLFDVAYEDIIVLVQPQSLIHSMVEFVDGSTKAHLGVPDMRIPIQYAFSYPDRWPECTGHSNSASCSFAAGNHVGNYAHPTDKTPLLDLQHPEHSGCLLDYRELGAIELGAPDTDTFGCLRLAYQAGEAGGTAPTILNAANEVAVAAFLDGTIGFLDIEALVGEALSHFAGDIAPLDALPQIEELDKRVRDRVAARARSRV